MSNTDWIVLIVTLSAIIIYGVYKSHTTKNLDGYFLSNRDMPWYLVLLSIMGTQASAITFLSAPGQAYTDGMRFVQYYFGLPLAMIVICIVFVPVFNRLKVYTAYEFLEKRFDLKTRTLTSFLFQISRGLSTGISIYAPSLILSSLLGWNIYYTNIIMGGMLIIYTVTGGARAVAHTQKLQLVIVIVGMAIAGYLVVHLMPSNVGFLDALHLGGKNGKMNIITSGETAKGFDWKDKYNIWSGIIGGFFLALSYFGTDQSQVGRYLTATDNIDKAKIKNEYSAVLSKALPGEDVNDTNYIFLRFVIDYLPKGLVGLLIAVIFLAAWGSIAAALNALASCTVVDIHKRLFKKDLTEKEDYRISKLYTFLWGIFCILVAEFALSLIHI